MEEAPLHGVHPPGITGALPGPTQTVSGVLVFSGWAHGGLWVFSERQPHSQAELSLWHRGRQGCSPLPEEVSLTPRSRQ